MHAHPMGAAAGVESLIKAAEATANGISLEEAAKDCESLQAALNVWGTGSNELFDLKK